MWKTTFRTCNSSLFSLLCMYMCEYAEWLLFPVSSQVRCTAADTSQPAGPRSGKRERGEGAGRGNQRAVLRRQVFRQNPPRPTSQVYEIKLDPRLSLHNSQGWPSQPVVTWFTLFLHLCTIHALFLSLLPPPWLILVSPPHLL